MSCGTPGYRSGPPAALGRLWCQPTLLHAEQQLCVCLVPSPTSNLQVCVFREQGLCHELLEDQIGSEAVLTLRSCSLGRSDSRGALCCVFQCQM